MGADSEPARWVWEARPRRWGWGSGSGVRPWTWVGGEPERGGKSRNPRQEEGGPGQLLLLVLKTKTFCDRKQLEIFSAHTYGGTAGQPT